MTQTVYKIYKRKYTGISLPAKSGHMSRSVCRITCKYKFKTYQDIFHYYYDTAFQSNGIFEGIR